MTEPGNTVAMNPLAPPPAPRSPRPAARAGLPGAALPAARSAPLAALALAGLMTMVALVAGCAGSPPVRLYQLRSEPPAAMAATAAQPAPVVWQLGRVQLPAYLDRDTLVLPTGQAGLQALTGHRWSEPLRDAVPRLLRQDLARLLGADKVWGQPLPAGVQITQQLQLEVQRLEPTAAGDAVVVQARWTLVDAAGKAPARVQEAELRVPTTGSDPDSLVSAHRAVLWQLAQRIAGSAAAP